MRFLGLGAAAGVVGKAESKVMEIPAAPVQEAPVPYPDPPISVIRLHPEIECTAYGALWLGEDEIYHKGRK